MIESEARNGILYDAGAFLPGDRGVGLIFEAEDLAALMMVPHCALEYGDGARMGVTGGFPEGCHCNRTGGEVEHLREGTVGELSHRRTEERG